MPFDKDGRWVSDSSSETEDQTQDANTAAESSTVEPEKDAKAGESESKEDLLSVVKNAGKDPEEDSDSTDESSASESKAETGETDDETGEEDGESGESDEEEGEEDADSEKDDKDQPPFHNHPRWKEVVNERDTFRQELEKVKPEAENYQRIQQFMEANDLTAEETARGFETMALMKQNPAAARQRLQEMMENLQPFDPAYVPPDIQKDLEDGHITEERARELARYRAESYQARHAHENLSRRHEQTEQERQSEREQAQRQQFAQAVSTWEGQVEQSDPDYAKKAPFVASELRARIQQSGMPKTQDDAVSMAKDAYKAVDKRLKGFAPTGRKRASNPTPSDGGSSSTKSEPETMDDAVRQAVGKV